MAGCVGCVGGSPVGEREGVREDDDEAALCGFSEEGVASPFHFGAAAPPVLRSGNGSFPLVPDKTEVLGGGLPARACPAVAATSGRWVEQLEKIRALPGADMALLEEVEGWVVHGVKSKFLGGTPHPLRALKNTSTFLKNEAVCLERLEVYREMGALRLLSQPPPPGGHVQPLHAVVKAAKKAWTCRRISTISCPTSRSGWPRSRTLSTW